MEKSKDISSSSMGAERIVKKSSSCSIGLAKSRAARSIIVRVPGTAGEAWGAVICRSTSTARLKGKRRLRASLSDGTLIFRVNSQGLVSGAKPGDPAALGSALGRALGLFAAPKKKSSAGICMGSPRVSINVPRNSPGLDTQPARAMIRRNCIKPPGGITPGAEGQGSVFETRAKFGPRARARLSLWEYQ